MCHTMKARTLLNAQWPSGAGYNSRAHRQWSSSCLAAAGGTGVLAIEVAIQAQHAHALRAPRQQATSHSQRPRPATKKANRSAPLPARAAHSSTVSHHSTSRCRIFRIRRGSPNLPSPATPRHTRGSRTGQLAAPDATRSTHDSSAASGVRMGLRFMLSALQPGEPGCRGNCSSRCRNAKHGAQPRTPRTPRTPRGSFEEQF